MDSLFPRDSQHLNVYEAGIEMEIVQAPGNEDLAVNNYVIVYLSQFCFMLTDMLIGLLPGNGTEETMEHYRREVEYVAMTRMVHITRNHLLAERVQTIMERQMEEAGFFANRTPVIRSVVTFMHYHGSSIIQPRIERSFELDILLKNFRMKQKKIDKDQRILPLTAIVIDCKLWGF